jgi:hypothetical protein
MKTAGVKEIKAELKTRSSKELEELCLQLSRFKKENKELLTYLLFESSDEAHYIKNVKMEVDGQFEQINTQSYYFIKKSVRKILRNIKKYIRYSKKKETEVELLLYFCRKLKTFSPSIQNNTVLFNIYSRELEGVKKKINNLHEDLQYDYGVEIESME